jgi:hypothetical protein
MTRNEALKALEDAALSWFAKGWPHATQDDVNALERACATLYALNLEAAQERTVVAGEDV